MKKNNEVLSSVHNAIRILKEFSPDNKELGITQLSHELNLAKSTVFRLMNTLCETNLVQKNPKTQKYRLGIGAFELGFLFYHTTEIRHVSNPIMERLVESTRKVARLAVYDRGGVVYLSKTIPRDDYGTISKTGNRVPCYCTAAGKILLAYQCEDEINRVLEKPRKRFTTNTITSENEILTQIKKARECGYATTNEELRVGISSVAVPVFDDFGQMIASLSLTGLKNQFLSGQIPYLVKELTHHSKMITEQLIMD
ncbi:IclR family transcriptional regulator [Halalkalibacterium ligniniphilum]|uniref:IclR family transcriptional regulator n=1 Tax=Halalkalibacterium ligniniphilum TaxID=1134413 RepID=UPI0003470483|nr:IclR family transcriptional regulator [Halalkalibacterium ligniniphilum]